MIYYYFGSKQGLYLAVLERAYAGIRVARAAARRRAPRPGRAMRALAELTFDHHESHPDFIRLVSIENIHRAEHLRTSPVLTAWPAPALDVLDGILERGRAAGAVPRRRRRARRAHGDQLVLRLPHGEPAHVPAPSSAATCSTPPAASTTGGMLGDLVVEYLTAHVGARLTAVAGLTRPVTLTHHPVRH